MFQRNRKLSKGRNGCLEILKNPKINPPFIPKSFFLPFPDWVFRIPNPWVDYCGLIRAFFIAVWLLGSSFRNTPLRITGEVLLIDGDY
jgi:hypothetical protein